MTESILNGMKTFELEDVFPEGEVIEEKKSSATRSVAKFIASSSVKFVIAGAITTLVPPAETKIQKVKLAVGTYVIAGMVAKQAKDYVDYKVDELSDDFRQLRMAIKKIENATKSDTPNT